MDSPQKDLPQNHLGSPESQNSVPPQGSSSSPERLRLLQIISQRENWVEVLKEALEVERIKTREYEEKGYGPYYGWEWHEVHTPIQTLHKMVTEHVLDVKLATRSGTHFTVRNPDMVREVLGALGDPSVIQIPLVSIPDLFHLIVGHDNIKSLIRYAIESPKPVHLLLSGPPASAKTLFLIDLAKLPNSYYCLAQTTSRAGLAGVLFTYQPEYLLIDEIDRLAGDHIGVLNSLMATGIVSETKFGKTRQMELPCKVFAAGIKTHLLPKDLLSRFIPIKFLPYTEEEFIQVSTRILVSREEVPEELSTYIAKSVWSRSQSSSDVRQVVQIARLSGNSLDRAKEILKATK